MTRTVGLERTVTAIVTPADFVVDREKFLARVHAKAQVTAERGPR